MQNYLLDTTPLGLLAHDNPKRRANLERWIQHEMIQGSEIFISEAADYEVRRELKRLVNSGQLPASRIDRLDRLANLLTYLSVSTSMWHRAAEFWAEARAVGQPTAGPQSLDADVLIAAQAREIQATVMTANPNHIGRWVPVIAIP